MADIFDGLFGDIDFGQIATGMPTPAMAPLPARIAQGHEALPQSPISPEFLAKNAAARGIPPPPVDMAPAAPAAPIAGSEEPTRLFGSTFGPDGGRGEELLDRPGGVGAALTGRTMPVMAQTEGPGAPLSLAPPAPGAAAPPEKNALMDALKGVKAPAAPELQRVGTPSAPRPSGTIKGGDIIALLQSLSQGRPGGLDLPSTLGQALMRK